MKLHTSIARYIRRCGYAVAITFATGSVVPAAQETVIQYLTHVDGSNPTYDQALTYNFNLDTVRPTDSAPIYDTEAIVNAIKDSNNPAEIRGWCPLRPTEWHNYDLFVTNPASTQYSNTVMRVSQALRPLIWNELNVAEISYIGARSLAPKSSDNHNCGDTGYNPVAPTATPIDTNYNKLIINNSGFALAVGAYSQYGDSCFNLTHIQDVRLSDDVWTSVAFRGECSDNTTIIIRAEAIGADLEPSDYTYGLSSSNYNNGGKVYGAFAQGKGTNANRNTVFVYGSSFYLHIAGAISAQDAIDNTVYIVKSEIAKASGGNRDYVDAVVGGKSQGNATPGIAKGNLVVVDDAFAGYIPPEEGRDETWTSTVAPISIIHTDIIGGLTQRGFGENGAVDNTVIVSGVTTDDGNITTVEGNIFGGMAHNETSSGYDNSDRTAPAGSATDNTVILSNMALKKDSSVNNDRVNLGIVYGGYAAAPSYEGQLAGNANRNQVFAKDIHIENSLYGGFNGGAGQASSNELHLENVRTENSHLTFYGGWINDANTAGQTNNNNVYLYNKGWNMDNTNLHGGWGSKLFTLDGADDYKTYTKNNWLHVVGYQGKLKGFDHFEEVHFVVTPEVDRNTPMITFTGDTGNEEEATSMVINTDAGPGERKLVHVTADISAIADQLKPGDIIPLFGHADDAIAIDGTNDIDKDSVVDDNAQHRRGVTRTVTLDTEFYEVNEEADKLSAEEKTKFKNDGVIKVLGKTEDVTPESKALLEGRIATLTLNNMGGNLVAEQGIDNACRGLDDATPGNENHFTPVEQNGKGTVSYVPKSELRPGNRLFFAMSGAHNKVDSGSDVDVDGTNALVGVSRGFLKQNPLLLGVFMETGWGKYHTNNNFGIGANTPHVRGSGETSYVGAGALLRYRLGHLSKKLTPFSLDASIRAGRQETDYSTPNLVDGFGNYASYEHESDYIAGHVGVNYTIKPTDKVTANFYARYLWTHISNDEADVCGERVNFADMSSNRFRLGARAGWQATENWTPYVGAAYEWECSGTARATTYGMGITAPGMRGGSVIGEAGVIWQPDVNRALWLEGAVQGSMGKNENYGAKVGVSIGF